MKVSSPRTWLIVATGVFVLAGAVVVYVVMKPSLPPGWSYVESRAGYRVAVPAGAADPGNRHEYALSSSGMLIIDPNDRCLTVGYETVGKDDRRDTPEDTIDRLILRETSGAEDFAIESQTGETVGDYPARAVVWKTSKGRGKSIVILVGERWYRLTAPLEPGQFTEAEGDIFLRSFRPK